MKDMELIRKDIQKYYNTLRLTKQEALDMVGKKEGYAHYESFYKVVVGERLTRKSDKNIKKLRSIRKRLIRLNESRQNKL